MESLDIFFYMVIYFQVYYPLNVCLNISHAYVHTQLCAHKEKQTIPYFMYNTNVKLFLLYITKVVKHFEKNVLWEYISRNF